MTRPPVASIPWRTRRRLTFSRRAWSVVMSRSCRCGLDGRGDALIAAAAADVAAHGVVDLALGRVLGRGEEGGRLHDLPGLAVAALRHVERAPSLLHGVHAVRIEAFDGDHGAAGDVAHRGGAGAGRLAVDMEGGGGATGQDRKGGCGRGWGCWVRGGGGRPPPPGEKRKKKENPPPPPPAPPAPPFPLPRPAPPPHPRRPPPMMPPRARHRPRH